MKLIKTKLASDTKKTVGDKRMMWTACTTMYHGLFRSSEILSREKDKYDPHYTLLGKDVKLVENKKETLLQIAIKAPKESKTNATILVDIYKSNSNLCPVRAFKKWQAMGEIEDDKPVFRFESGELLTSNWLNRWLRETLSDLGSDNKCYTTHSFRIGAATALAQLGFGESDIKSAGRWSSRAFELYVRTARTHRKTVVGKWAKLNRV